MPGAVSAGRGSESLSISSCSALSSLGCKGYNNCHAARKQVLFTCMTVVVLSAARKRVLFTTEVQASQLIASGSRGHAAVVVTLL